MKRLSIASFLAMTLVLGLPRVMLAVPSYLSEFNTLYGTSGTVLNTCILCHTTASGPALNPYGTDVAGAHTAGTPVTPALTAIEPLDSDGDTFTNIVEINARTFPGDPTSFPASPGLPPMPGSTPNSAPIANPPANNILVSTTWTGDLIVVSANGSVQTITGTTLTFHAQDNCAISGTFSDPSIAFSGIVSNDDFIELSAVNYSISARIIGSEGIEGRERRSSALKTNRAGGSSSHITMWVKGKNFADGSIFHGTLVKQ